MLKFTRNRNLGRKNWKKKLKFFWNIFVKLRKKMFKFLGAKNCRKNLHKHPGPPFQIRGGPGSFSNALFLAIFPPTVCFIINKNEVQTVILRCSMGLNLDWFKIYGLWYKWRSRVCLCFYYHILPFFCQLYVNLSQIWDPDRHFEVLNQSKS